MAVPLSAIGENSTSVCSKFWLTKYEFAVFLPLQLTITNRVFVHKGAQVYLFSYHVCALLSKR